MRAHPTVLPKSPLGKAIDYTLTLWPKLEVFLRHGEVEADTNLIENAVRPSAVGKKNWMYVGGEDTGERSAVIRSPHVSIARDYVWISSWWPERKKELLRRRSIADLTFTSLGMVRSGLDG